MSPVYTPVEGEGESREAETISEQSAVSDHLNTLSAKRYVLSVHPLPSPPPSGDCVAMKEKGRHSRESGNPGNLKKNKLLEITRYFSMPGPAWMPASAGMTNYDPAS
jgi:hypothetical protein